MPAAEGGMPELSVFFFSSADAGPVADRYADVLQTAVLAEQLGFTAVWLPERHFHTFGGLFPNPAVLAAALAVRTTRIGIRAGSVVLPLHHVARVAEEWAVVDALSNGRVGLSLATGWNRGDFVLGSCAYDRRREHLFATIDVLESLWSGQEVEFETGGAMVPVRTYPRPNQPVLPLWLTATSGTEMFVEAGRRGCRLLTAFLQQSPPQLSANIAAYREAFAAHHPERAPHVTVMVHAYVGTSASEALAVVAGPLMAYQGEFLSLQRRAGDPPDGGGALSPADQHDLARYSAYRYAREQGLVGGPGEAAARLRTFTGMGVDEVACLVDFGITAEQVSATLYRLACVAELDGRRCGSGQSSDGASADQSSCCHA